MMFSTMYVFPRAIYLTDCAIIFFLFSSAINTKATVFHNFSREHIATHYLKRFFKFWCTIHVQKNLEEKIKEIYS